MTDLRENLPDRVYVVTTNNPGKKLHADSDCNRISQAATREVKPEKYPANDLCSFCVEGKEVTTAEKGKGKTLINALKSADSLDELKGGSA